MALYPSQVACPVKRSELPGAHWISALHDGDRATAATATAPAEPAMAVAPPSASAKKSDKKKSDKKSVKLTDEDADPVCECHDKCKSEKMDIFTYFMKKGKANCTCYGLEKKTKLKAKSKKDYHCGGSTDEGVAFLEKKIEGGRRRRGRRDRGRREKNERRGRESRRRRGN